MKLKIFSDKFTGQIWCVRVVEQGEGYGLYFKVIHEEERKLVEFYDCRYEHTDCGQFVSRYYLDTILEHEEGVGLDLYGDVPSWKISGVTMDRIVKWLKENV